MDNETKISILMILIVLSFFLGILAYKYLSSPMELLNSNTLIINRSNEWYYLQNQEYTNQQLNEYYTLKRILIKNECIDIDDGFIENVDGNQFLIVCYEVKKIIEENTVGGKNEK